MHNIITQLLYISFLDHYILHKKMYVNHSPNKKQHIFKLWGILQGNWSSEAKQIDTHCI
jgi:hypothetical protein